MQRPRSKLQVSTFPFLAVLLCAMGALLLLLFIMDRRAKIAAQYTVAEAVAERKKRSQEEEDARKAEWERARALLHQSLLEQQNQLLGDAKGIEHGLSDADDKLAVVQTQHGDLEEKIKAETAQISVLQLRIASQDADVKNADKMATKSKAELMEAAKELAELEQAFRRLKALRERDKETYSVVPYRGKRGDLRPPIYVECLRDGVIFHPEKRALQNWEFTADSLRAEVERRTGPLALDRPVKDVGREITADRKVPYVLFLVRPDGIGSYYKAQGGLKGYQLDFGYELVDEYWVLDFNGDSNAKPLPTNFAKSGSAQTPSFRPASFNGGGGLGQAGSGSGGLRPGGWGNGNAGGTPGGNIGGAPGGFGPGPGGFGPGPGGMPAPVGFGNGNIGTPGGLGNSAYRGLDTGIPTSGPAFVPFSRQQQPIAIASSGAGDPSLPFSGGTAPSPRPDLITPLGGPSGPGIAPGYPAGGNAGNAAGSNGTSPGVPGRGGSLPSLTLPIPGNNVGSGQAGAATSPGQGGQPGGGPSSPGQGGQPGGGASSPGQGGQPGAGPSSPGQSGDPGAGSPSQGQGGPPGGGPSSQGQGGQPGGSPGSPGPAGQAQDQGGGEYMPGPRLPSFGPEAPRKPPTPPSPLSKLLGNKDFVITIGCYAEHVTVSPSGLQYRWDQGNVAANEKALVQTVTNLIARRQASVRPGEPPYRPIIRFQVPPDGYATYFRAYPLLEPLQVPMTKENTRD